MFLTYTTYHTYYITRIDVRYGGHMPTLIVCDTIVFQENMIIFSHILLLVLKTT